MADAKEVYEQWAREMANSCFTEDREVWTKKLKAMLIQAHMNGKNDKGASNPKDPQEIRRIHFSSDIDCFYAKLATEDGKLNIDFKIMRNNTLNIPVPAKGQNYLGFPKSIPPGQSRVVIDDGGTIRMPKVGESFDPPWGSDNEDWGVDGLEESL